MSLSITSTVPVTLPARTTYATELVPVRFTVSSLSPYNNIKKIEWDFNDGTIVQATSSSILHTFKNPGVYRVSARSYNYVGGTDVGYISLTALSPVNEALRFPTNTQTLLYPLTAGVIRGPISLSSYVGMTNIHILSSQGATIVTHVSGSTDNNYSITNSDLDTPYLHLVKTWSFYTSAYNTLTNYVEYIPVNNVVAPVTLLYGKISGSSLLVSTLSTSGSEVVGGVGIENVFVKVDTPASDINLIFSQHPKDVSPNATTQHVNMLPYNLNTYVLSNVPTQLKVSANGLTGEGVNHSVYDIYPIKFTSQKIPFVVTLKDSRNYTIRYGDTFVLNHALTSAYNEIIVQPSSPLVTVYTETSQVSALPNVGCMFKGYLECETPVSNVVLAVTARFYNTNGSTATLQGSSTSFDILSAATYKISKINEDFDAGDALRSLRFQEYLAESTNLFDQILPSMLGDNTLNPEHIGVKTYEKMANFAANHIDVDTANVRNLYSLFDSIEVPGTVYDKYRLSYPAQIRRLLDLTSINYSRLRGSINQFDEDYNSRGNPCSTTYGGNLGSELNVLTSILTAGQQPHYIVAFETYSGEYTLLNTNILCAAEVTYIDPSTYTYSISAYNSSWGWNLVLPTYYLSASDDINRYYTFFEFLSGSKNERYGNIIDYTNINTTVTLSSVDYNDWSRDDGVLTQTILSVLNDNLSLK